MKRIPLIKGKGKGTIIAYTLVDDEDYEVLSQWKWLRSSWGYAIRREPNNKTIYMHKVILGSREKVITDHIDGNKLNNQKNNIRSCTHQENMFGFQLKRKSDKATSVYRGVCWDKSKNKWKSSIKIDYKGKFLGRFDDEISAALAYNAAAIKYFGEFASLNKIENNKAA